MWPQEGLELMSVSEIWGTLFYPAQDPESTGLRPSLRGASGFRLVRFPPSGSLLAALTLSGLPGQR